MASLDLCIDPQDYRPDMLQPATEGSLLQVLLVEDDDADAYLISEVLIRDPRVGALRRAPDGDAGPRGLARAGEVGGLGQAWPTPLVLGGRGSARPGLSVE